MTRPQIIFIDYSSWFDGYGVTSGASHCQKAPDKSGTGLLLAGSVPPNERLAAPTQKMR